MTVVSKKNIVFLVLMALLTLSSTGILPVVRAEGEAEGECVTADDGETCVNPEEAAAAEAAAAAAAEREEQERRRIMEEEEAARERDRQEQERRRAEETAAREEEERRQAAEAAAQAAQEEEERRLAEEAAEAAENTPDCPSRKHVIKCAAEYLDTNGNGKLERVELQSAIDKLPWLSRGVLTILGSVNKMMAKCDMDGDDAISYGCPDCDMENNGETCLASCFKRRAFKSAFFPDCKA